MVEVASDNKQLRNGDQLRLLAAQGDAEAIAKLLSVNIAAINSKDEGGYTALQRAASQGHVEAIRVLLKNGAHVDSQDNYYGNTALHEATWKGHSRTAEILVKAKSHVYTRNKGGFTPLHLACQNGHNQSCRVLLLASCKPDIKNNYGDTPLHTAARYGHAGVTRILLSARASPKEVNKNGDTSLHIAAAMGRRKLTKILLEAGSSQTIKNKQNETAMDIAQRKEYSEILEILRNPPAVISHEDRMKKEREDSKKKHESSKKKEKSNDSGTSSRDSAPKLKDRKEKRDVDGKSKSKPSDLPGSGVNWSPYGCHCAHNEQPTIDRQKLDALPLQPLEMGEQYFVDLAGNVKKGPIGISNTCKCAPLFEKVHHKMQKDKRDLMDHIDAANTKLGKRISSLESHTKNHIDKLGNTVQQKLASERTECRDRTAKLENAATKEISTSVAQLRQWVENKIKNEHINYSQYRRRSSLDGGRDSMIADFPLVRSRSDEGISEFHDEEESVYKGLRVLDHPTSLFNIPQVVQRSQKNPSQGSGSSCFRKQRRLSDGCNSTVYNGDIPHPAAQPWRSPNINARIHHVNGRPPELNDNPVRPQQLDNRNQMLNRNIADLNNIVDNLRNTDRRKPLPLNYSFDREFSPRAMHNGTSGEFSPRVMHNNTSGEFSPRGVHNGTSGEFSSRVMHNNTSGEFSPRVMHNGSISHDVYPGPQEQLEELHLHKVNGPYSSQQPYVQPVILDPIDPSYLEYRLDDVEGATYIDMDRCKVTSISETPETHPRPGFALESPKLLQPPMEGFTEQDSHNDSGYSTRLCSTSRGPSPNIIGPIQQRLGEVPDPLHFRTFTPNTSRLSLPSPTTLYRHQSPAFPRMFEQRFFPPRMLSPRPNLPFNGVQQRFTSPGLGPHNLSNVAYLNHRRVPNVNPPRPHIHHLRPPSLV